MRQGVLFSEAGWGGKRKNAGAKPKPGAGVPHDRREDFKNRGVHVTLKLMREFNGLRHAPESELVRKVLRASSDAPACSGVRVLHYSIQWDHLHLIVEARDAAALSAAMKSLCVRLAKGLNRSWQRKGPVHVDRYHSPVARRPLAASSMSNDRRRLTRCAAVPDHDYGTHRRPRPRPRNTKPPSDFVRPRARRLRGGVWTPLVSVTVGSGPHFPGAAGALAGRCRRWRRRGASPPFPDPEVVGSAPPSLEVRER